MGTWHWEGSRSDPEDTSAPPHLAISSVAPAFQFSLVHSQPGRHPMEVDSDGIHSRHNPHFTHFPHFLTLLTPSPRCAHFDHMAIHHEMLLCLAPRASERLGKQITAAVRQISARLQAGVSPWSEMGPRTVAGLMDEPNLRCGWASKHSSHLPMGDRTVCTIDID